MDGRVIIHIDLDCFYVQVHTRSHPELKGKPVAVRQYKGLIAVSYEARALGVTRGGNSDMLAKQIPELIFCDVPKIRDKVSLQPYRLASLEVFEVLRRHVPLCEKASIDEAYLDVTEMVDERLRRGDDETWAWHGTVEGGEREGNRMSEGDTRLMVGSCIAAEIREDILRIVGFTTSAGIGHNKLLAKMGSSRNKPNGQTIIRACVAEAFVHATPLRKIPGLGGKLGKQIRDCQTGADVARLSLSALEGMVGEESAAWVLRRINGINHSVVEDKGPPRSLLSSKSFQLSNSEQEITDFVFTLATDLSQRVEHDSAMYARYPQTLVLNTRLGSPRAESSGSKSRSFPSATSPEAIHAAAMELLAKFTWKAQKLSRLSLSAIRFTDAHAGPTIASFFSKAEPLGRTGTDDLQPSTVPDILPSHARGGAPEGEAPAGTSVSSPVRGATWPVLEPPAPAPLLSTSRGGGSAGSSYACLAASLGLPKESGQTATSSMPSSESCGHQQRGEGSPMAEGYIEHGDMDCIDPAVLAALPLDIQAELKMMRHTQVGARAPRARDPLSKKRKRASTDVQTSKRSKGSIKQFFSQR